MPGNSVHSLSPRWMVMGYSVQIASRWGQCSEQHTRLRSLMGEVLSTVLGR